MTAKRLTFAFLAGTALPLLAALAAPAAAAAVFSDRPLVVAQADPQTEREQRRQQNIEQRQQTQEQRQQQRQQIQEQRQQAPERQQPPDQRRQQLDQQREQRQQIQEQRPQERQEQRQEQRQQERQEQRPDPRPRDDRQQQELRRDELRQQRQQEQQQNERQGRERQQQQEQRQREQEQLREQRQQQRQDNRPEQRDQPDQRQQRIEERLRQRQENLDQRQQNRQENRQENRQDQRQENRQEQRLDQRDQRLDQQQQRLNQRDQRLDQREDRLRDQRQENRAGRVEDLRRDRRERVELGGRRIVITEPGNRTIIREGNRVFIRHDEDVRLRSVYRNATIRRERRGADFVEVIRRPNGVEVVTVRDARGNLVRRVRRFGGRDVVLIQNIVRGPSYVEVVELPPPRIVIPREQYIVDIEGASQEQLYDTLIAPPVERIEGRYSLDQIRRSPALRERMRRVDIDTVTFDLGAWDLSDEQAKALTGIAEAIRRAVEQNPNEIFLVEGHTDAIGDDLDNLTLSDRRAETVARILSEVFEVPAENLTTQGYGRQYLKIDTPDAERRNRRVTVRRITPLLQQGEAAPPR